MKYIQCFDSSLKKGAIKTQTKLLCFVKILTLILEIDVSIINMNFSLINRKF